MVKANLPPQSALWGRDVEKRLRALEANDKKLSALITSSNNRVDAILSAQSTIAQTQALIQSAQETIATTQTALATMQSSLNTQVQFLADQTVSGETAPSDFTTITFTAFTEDIPLTWLPYDPAADTELQIHIPSTGKVSVQASGFISVLAENSSLSSGFIGVEVLDEDGDPVKNPTRGDGIIVEWGVTNDGQVTIASTGQAHVWSFLHPGALYTFRTRRGYYAATAGLSSNATIQFQGTGLTISKVGM